MGQFRYMAVLTAIVLVIASCASLPQSPAQDGRLVSSVDATSAWNSVCGSYHFLPKPISSSITFSQGYYGSDYATESAGVTAAVNQILGSIWEPMEPDKAMKPTIENWDQAGGGM